MRPLAVAIVIFATGLAFGAGVQLELRSAKPQQLVLEPIDLQLFLVNRGVTPVSVAIQSASTPRLRIQINDEWFGCASSLAICARVNERPWTLMEPGAELRLGPLPDKCPWRAGETYRDVKDWVGIPGHYKFQAEARLTGSPDLP